MMIKSRHQSQGGVQAKRSSDAVAILNRMAGDDPSLLQSIEASRTNARVAQLIYVARADAGLTQAELAALIGTRQPVIARLEDADYAGHSLSMLQKIAAALGRTLQIEMPPAGKAKHRAK